jgi:hypothetical protein
MSFGYQAGGYLRRLCADVPTSLQPRLKGKNGPSILILKTGQQTSRNVLGMHVDTAHRINASNMGQGDCRGIVEEGVRENE